MSARVPTPGSGPERTCLGCRKRDRQSALVRLVADGDRVVIDAAGSRAGRGAWVHRDPKCAARLAIGGLERGLKRKLPATALAGLPDAVRVHPDRTARQSGPDQVQLPAASPPAIAGDSSRTGSG
jgi:predicted RNA-binding protein YlxR (DUF448 family)